MINKVGKVTVFVEDQEEARKFWTEKAGFVVAFEQPMGHGMTWLEVAPTKEAATTFILYEKKAMLNMNPKANVSHPQIILSCSEIEKTKEDMEAKGVKTTDLKVMPYGKMFTFEDQDGNQYMLRED